MSIIQPIVDWTTRTLAPLGYWGLFLLAFTESSFNPIPVETLLAVLIIENPGMWWLYAIVAVIGSVLGAVLGYGIGIVGEKAILERFFDKKKIDKVHKLYDKHGAWAVFIGAFTPLPYKLFTVSAGAFYIHFWKFMIASLIGRTLRFFVASYLLYLYGAEFLKIVDRYFLLIVIAGIVGLGVYGLYYYYCKKKISKKSRLSRSRPNNDK